MALRRRNITEAVLTTWGLKDVQPYSAEVTTHSGTASDESPLFVCAHVAQHCNRLFPVDIDIALLKGVTCAEHEESIVRL